MRFLADENISKPTVETLRKLGFDVTQIQEIRPGLPDREVLRHCQSEELILLTFDRDFGELCFKHALTPPPAIIHFRFIPQNSEEAALLLEATLKQFPEKILGHYLVIERDKVRTRKLSV